MSGKQGRATTSKITGEKKALSSPYRRKDGLWATPLEREAQQANDGVHWSEGKKIAPDKNSHSGSHKLQIKWVKFRPVARCVTSSVGTCTLQKETIKPVGDRPSGCLVVLTRLVHVRNRVSGAHRRFLSHEC
ncbi:uncharacterized protein CIMG_13620 [Coccidioides immitis RS]|uniref:Uncharacterized protein n=1 Tax=Coccidioides immitis (strain RS) TaxID=246410 RepID=A0A0D8JW94_COCIM|nr:uncharacterized protein CIMG_13620 [Coccidioides immitis RS]KJF61394.1 hypothetical protein CIMG_13620 [Coccidioides immitis RS]